MSSAALMVAIGATLFVMMPRYQPRGGLHYGQILASMASLLREIRVLRWRAAYQALMFAAFNLFWTSVPLVLAEHFELTEHGIGWFALAGAGGALAAPIAGRLADRSFVRATTIGAMVLLSLSFLATTWAAAFTFLPAMLVFTILIDAAVQANHVVSQRIIFSVPTEVRGRVNAIYMTATFAGGASGSMLGTLTYHSGGWTLTAIVGGLFGLACLTLLAAQHPAPDGK